MGYKTQFQGFLDFVREQGVVGLAIGFVMGGAVSKVVSSLVTDIINPVVGLILGSAGNLKDMALSVGPVKIMWGDFVSATIDFLIIALIVYYGFKILSLNRLAKKKA